MGYKLKRATIRVNNTTRGLPSEYQEVEYIQSSGTQHFIVGTSFKTSYKSVIDFQMTQTGGDQVIIGFNFAPYRYGINAYSNNFKVITGNTSGWSDTISEDTNRHTLTIDKSTATVDGNNYTISGYTNVTVNGGIGVFAHNDNGVGNYFARVKIYKLDIYDESGTLIYHLVPCYRKSDTVIGMYDIVNNTFYTNSGTGTFTKGADVPSMIEKQIRPRGWQPGANTVAYYPLNANSQLNDLSGNSYTLTSNAGYTFGTYQGVSCVSMTGNSNNSHLSSSTVPVGNTRTALARIYCTKTSSNKGVVCTGNSYNDNMVGMGVNGSGKCYVTDWKTADTAGTTGVMNSWHLIALTWTNGNGIKLYVDGALEATSPTYTRSTGTGFTIGSKMYVNSGSPWSESYGGYISEVIFEDIEWAASDVLAYYNQTKSKYGIS